MHSKTKTAVQTVASRLKIVREQAGCTGRAMASRLGITPGGYTKNEQGMNFPRLDTLQRLSEVFHVSLDWLLLNKGPMYYKEKGEKGRELEQTVDRLEQTREELEQKVTELESQLEVERRERERVAQEKAAAIESNPEVRTLLDYMERVPVFYHELMLYFHKYKDDKEEKIESPMLPDQT